MAEEHEASGRSRSRSNAGAARLRRWRRIMSWESLLPTEVNRGTSSLGLTAQHAVAITCAMTVENTGLITIPLESRGNLANRWQRPC
jgi:hypothetical protein